MRTSMDRFGRVLFASVSTLVLAISIVHGTPLHPYNVGHDDYDGRPVLQEKHECERSADCGPGRFCYKETFKCANCTDCSSRFRHNGEWPCAEQASECGACLPGYVEVRLERGVSKESCTLQTVGAGLPFKDTPQPIGSENMFNFVWIFAGLGGVSILFVGSFLINRWQRGRRDPEPMQELAPLNGNASQSIDMPPPPYSSAAPAFDGKYYESQPTAPTLDSMVEVDSPRNCDTNITVATQPPIRSIRVDEHLVQAVGYRPPSWVDLSQYTGDQSPPPSPTNENHPDDNLADILNDQSTQESEWTPNSSQGNVEERASIGQAINLTVPQTIGSTAVGTTGQDNASRVRARADSTEGASSQDSQESDGQPCEKRPRSNSEPREQGASVNVNSNNISNQCNLVMQFHFNVPGSRADSNNQQEPSQPALPEFDNNS